MQMVLCSIQCQNWKIKISKEMDIVKRKPNIPILKLTADNWDYDMKYQIKLSCSPVILRVLHTVLILGRKKLEN